ncbi:MAG: cofactor-independent phosphoglycerate mutase [Deltaproteobacteria bacterium]|nr:cofactor-independent phosphoglycerate mutase [Deltaproteobacteria bacterium]
MKYVIIQGDGMGDIRGSSSGATTPLEAARTPSFDKVAGCGRLGLLHTIPEGYPPGSDVGNLALFGYDPRRFYTGRSPLEAAAMNVGLGERDVAFRLNLVSTRDDGAGLLMDDFSGGHVDSESAAKMVKTLDEQLGNSRFQFYPGVSYRHLMVWRDGLLKMTTTPPHDISDQPLAGHLPVGEGAGELIRIMEASRELLTGHPANLARVSQGHKPISQAWLWGQGLAPEMPRFKDLHGLSGAVISAVDLVRGVAIYAGFEIIQVPGITGFIDTDYSAKGRYALKALQTHDLVFVHIEAPDEAGHMGSREEKIKAIEEIDTRIVAPLLEQLPALGPFKILITSDHATPVSLKTHSLDPVPFAMASGEQLARGGTSRKFGEEQAGNTGDVIGDGYRVIKELLAL